jgi:2-dehydropantoate 2-reductase
MTAIRSIAILGAGAMGGFYAGKFYHMNSNSVCLVAGGERFERLQKQGVVVNDRRYPLTVVRPEDRKTPPSDLVMVAVKYHHLQRAIRDMENRVGDNTVILTVMNGIDSEEKLGAVYGMDKVLYAVAVGTFADRRGHVISCRKEGTLFFGEAQNPTITPRIRSLQALFDRAHIAHETPADMMRAIWLKFMANVGLNQASAVVRAPNAVFQRSAEGQALLESIMREVVAVGRAAQVDLSERDIEAWRSYLAQIPPEGKTSTLQDVEAGRKTEVEMFAGQVVALGGKYGIPTPVNETLLRIIQVIEQTY